MIRSPLMNIGALFALQSLSLAGSVAAVQESYDPGSILLPTGLGFGGSGPIHRRGRFKRNQMRQRKGQK